MKNISIISLFIFLNFSCNSNNGYEPIVPLAVHPNGMEYISNDTCVDCHSDIVEIHKQTAHYLTSADATENSIKGSFVEGKNGFRLNDEVAFRMIKTDSGFFQEPYLHKQDKIIYSAPMDFVLGSGTKGQSFAFWNKDELYQLQASYFTPTDSWVNSPGFPSNLTQARPIPGRCLECHATFAEKTDTNYTNRFNRSTLVNGVDCQRCHGAVREHVIFHRNNPNDSIPKFIMSYKDLDRGQRLDACALCHSGLREVQAKDNFSFFPGDRLDKFSLPDYTESDLGKLDVHGNQYGLLQASECFKKSEIMDCTTCHNPHKNERGNTNVFNLKCISCHSGNTSHHLPNKSLASGFENCIECHMPLVESNVMKIQVAIDSVVSVNVRTHLIGIYDDNSQ